MTDKPHHTDSAWLVLHEPGHPPRTVQLVDESGAELTIGRAADHADIPGHLSLTDDPSVSRLHAVMTLKAPGWCVQAANSTSGLYVNGVRLAPGAVHLLVDDDELRLGERTMVRFHTLAGTRDRSSTQTARPVPELTAAERRVLLCLCSPVIDGDAFTPPATVAAIAADLYVTDSAVKQQLVRLYLKFGIDDGPDRRVRLANDALSRGAVRRADLQTFRTAT